MYWYPIGKLPPSIMQAQSTEMKQGASGSEGDRFKEEACLPRLFLSYWGTKYVLLDVLCILERGWTPQQIMPWHRSMRGGLAVILGLSSHIEGFSEIPKDVTALKPAIGLLMEKVNQSIIWSVLLNNATQATWKGVSKEWLSLARSHAQWLKDNGTKVQTKMEGLLSNLNDEITLIDFLTKEIGWW